MIKASGKSRVMVGMISVILILSVWIGTTSAVFGASEAADNSGAGESASAAADTGGGFLYQREIQMEGEGEYQSVQLDRENYNHMEADARDLRVLDQDGKMAAYFLYGAEQETLAEEVSFYAEETGRFVKDGGLNIDFAITKSPQEDVYGNNLQVMTHSDGFAKEMTFWGSHDGRVWSVITTELIYRMDRNEKMDVALDDVVKVPFFRITIPDNSENVTVDSLSLVYTKAIAWQKDFVDSFRPDFAVVEEDKRTVITIAADTLKNLRINRITIETEDIFNRRVTSPLAEDILYHLAFQELSLRKTFLEGYGGIFRAQGDEDFQIVIENGDDTPLRIDGIVVEYACERVVFKREGSRSYSLAYGNPALEKPVYDIASYAGYILRGGVEAAVLGEARYFAPDDETPTKKIDDTVWLNIVVGAASLVLIALIVKAAVKKTGS